MDCHGISGILGTKTLTKNDSRLRLVLDFRFVKEHAIVHRDACSLSFLKVRGLLHIL